MTINSEGLYTPTKQYFDILIGIVASLEHSLILCYETAELLQHYLHALAYFFRI
jgi:hypothetical protein